MLYIHFRKIVEKIKNWKKTRILGHFDYFGPFWDKYGGKSISTMEIGDIIKLTLLDLLHNQTATCIGIF